MPNAGEIAAFILIGASAMYGLVLFAFAKARRRLPLTWSAISCLMMGVYSFNMLFVTFPHLSPAITGYLGPTGYAIASMFTLSATRYAYHRVPNSRPQRWFIIEAVLIVTAIGALIPDVAFQTSNLRSWTSLQTEYRLAKTTAIAPIFCLSITIGLLNLARICWISKSIPLLFGGACLAAAGGSDMAISLGMYEFAFTAAAGALAFLTTTAVDESSRWGDEAKQLSDLKQTLEERVQQRTDELTATLDKLSRSERLAALGKLAASIGHEINNPLTYVIVNLGLLKANPTSRDGSGLDDAIEGAERIARIVSQLRVLSKSPETQREVVDVDQALRVAAKTVQHLASECKIVTVLSKPDVAYVLGDEVRMTQLFINLLSNSLESMANDGQVRHVRVFSTLRDQSVMIRFEDEGQGIPANIRDRMFEPFATNRVQGLGLGLSIVQLIIEEMGGSIKVFSEETKGTTFTVELPITHEKPQASMDLQEQEEPEYSAEILIIDDEKNLLVSLGRSLAKHDVTVSADGASALELMRRRLFDVVLCDLVMPNLTGIDILDRSLLINPEYEGRFILMSGGTPSDDLSAKLAKTQTPFLAKPIRIPELQTAIQSVLSHKV